MKNELKSLASEFFHGGYTPNASDKVVREVRPGAALTAFLVSVQGRGADMERWTTSEWRDMLVSEFGVPEDEVVGYLEEIAAWGAVDDADWQNE